MLTQPELLQLKRKFEEALSRLQQVSVTDSLTGLASQRHFDNTLRMETRRAMRGHYFLSLIKVSIDHFKCYNDVHGRQCGDELLQGVATILKNSTKRVADFVTYCGDGEFYIILPMTDTRGTLHIAWSMQESVALLHISHKGNTASEFVTLSLGTATALGELGLTSSKLTAMADEALYRAKCAAGNRVVEYSG